MTVDNAAPTAQGTATSNGSINGRPETGDAATFTFSEQMDAAIVFSGWTQESKPDRAVAVTFNDSGTNDSMSVTGQAGTTVNLGTLTGLGNLANGGSYSFNATIRHSTSGGTTVVTITLGSLTSGGSFVATTTEKRYTWEPPTAAKDTVGNAMASGNQNSANEPAF